MHVEPECRGQGLAKLLARQAWRKHLDYYRTKFVDQSTSLDERWAHADVAVDNIASNAVCKSLGGTVRWGNYWQKIDLTRLAN
ncbi:hypothetical protein K461DRAFT_274966 [Myriangium duriaei CBS 260.36]|uniref:N-acetyltransferase domain-containing protein n=1 Tax=Myriangium duriaei CBS 260.36 TaxID=1168546 RepID=A0A9P4MN62_9PEZI|nr:hypothetical protein K461DRAFT_274966 [Myriangium duriaei CBS 260.36]